jgi:hypothetical protein
MSDDCIFYKQRVITKEKISDWEYKISGVPEWQCDIESKSYSSLENLETAILSNMTKERISMNFHTCERKICRINPRASNFNSKDPNYMKQIEPLDHEELATIALAILKKFF